MDIWLAIMGAALFISIAWAYASTRHSVQLITENARLQKRINDLQLAGNMAINLIKLNEKNKISKPFDSKTYSLIKLGALSPNENEAQAAAIKACKRIYGKL